MRGIETSNDLLTLDTSKMDLSVPFQVSFADYTAQYGHQRRGTQGHGEPR